MHQRLTCTQMQIKRIQRLCAGISFQGQSSITPTWIFPGGVSQRDLHRSLPCRLMRCTFIRGKYLVLIVGSLRYFGATSHGSTGVEGPRTAPLVWQPSCQSTPEFRSMPYGTAFCQACRRQRLFCHYCHQCAWCTPAAWSQPAIERVEMEPQRVWEG